MINEFKFFYSDEKDEAGILKGWLIGDRLIET